MTQTQENNAISTASVPEDRRVCAVVVCYNTGSRVHATLKPLYAQTDHIILVDNASEDATRELLETITSQRPEDMELLVRGDCNLAAGQNAGIVRALELGYGRVLLMDDDSIADAGMVAAMQAVAASYPAPERIGILAPCRADANSARRARYPVSWRYILPWRRGFGKAAYLDGVIDVVASGSLISAPVLRDIGLMNERYGIDYVDKEFCLRVILSGRQIVVVRDAVLHHRLGECRDHRLCGLPVTTRNHSPARRYTIYRNRLRTWRRYGRKVPAFLLHDMASLAYDLLRLLCFEEQKWAKFKAIAAGVRDAVRGER